MAYMNQEQTRSICNPLTLALIILIEGFVSIATEILAIRQLLPVAGGSVIVTSLVIGVFLLFLAIGYQQGGKSKASPLTLLCKNFFIAANWLGVGLSYLFISLFFFYTHRILGPHVIYPLMLYLLVVVAPLIYLLGQTLPIIMNLIRQNERVGTIGGYALSLSTMGSFLGSILTSLVTFHYLGVAYTVFLNSLLLLGLSLLLTNESWFKQITYATATLFISFTLNVCAEKIMFKLTNSYANYQLIASIDNHSTKQKILVINESLGSRLDEHGHGFAYIELIKKILFADLKIHGKNVLVLGAGGFSLSSENKFANQFTYVDIDHQLKQVAVPKFIKSLNSKFIADDARHFLSVNKKKYTAIVSDVYTDYKAIPAHLVTAEYLKLIKTNLEPEGVAIFNIVANPMLADPYSKHIDNTLRAVFQNCMALPQTYSNRVTNIIYVCSQLGHEDHRIYTDNLNQSTTDSFNW